MLKLNMMIVLLIALLSVAECDNRTVVGQTGQRVTLPCNYDRKYPGAADACWAQGDLPRRGMCGSYPLIFTDGRNVTFRTSSRYQLLGWMDEGDISLTILNLTEKDGGRYGCRVDIPGPFNDIINYISLIVVKGSAPDSTTAPPSSPETAATPSAGHMTTEDLLTSSSATNKTSEDLQNHSPQTGVLLCLLVLLVVLISAGGLFIIARRWKQLKGPQQPVHIGSTSSTLQLHHQTSATENIYQIEGGADNSDYEFCP